MAKGGVAGAKVGTLCIVIATVREEFVGAEIPIYRGTNIDANGFSVPGAATWSGSIELGFPLFATRNRKSVNLLESLRGAAFIDFGASGSDFGDMDPTRVSAGLAFRLRMPALAQLPMSFILAKPLHSEEGDQTSTFQFLIGSF